MEPAVKSSLEKDVVAVIEGLFGACDSVFWDQLVESLLVYVQEELDCVNKTMYGETPLPEETEGLHHLSLFSIYEWDVDQSTEIPHKIIMGLMSQGELSQLELHMHNISNLKDNRLTPRSAEIILNGFCEGAQILVEVGRRAGAQCHEDVSEIQRWFNSLLSASEAATSAQNAVDLLSNTDWCCSDAPLEKCCEGHGMTSVAGGAVSDLMEAWHNRTFDLSVLCEAVHTNDPVVTAEFQNGAVYPYMVNDGWHELWVTEDGEFLDMGDEIKKSNRVPDGLRPEYLTDCEGYVHQLQGR